MYPQAPSVPGASNEGAPLRALLVSSAVLLSLVFSFLRLPPVGLMIPTLGWPPEWLLRGERPCDIMSMVIIVDRIIIVAKISKQRCGEHNEIQ